MRSDWPSRASEESCAANASIILSMRMIKLATPSSPGCAGCVQDLQFLTTGYSHAA